MFAACSAISGFGLGPPVNLQELLDRAVESICNKQRQDIRDAVLALQGELHSIKQALELLQQSSTRIATKGVELDLHGCGNSGAQRLRARASPEATDSPSQPIAMDQGPSMRPDCQSFKVLGSCDSTMPHAGNLRPSVERTRGYSAVHIMHLLSGCRGDILGEEAMSPGRGLAISVLSTLVVASVLASTLALGLSMDIYPDSTFWVVLEAACVGIFSTEFMTKVAYLEGMAYFCGPLRKASTHDFCSRCPWHWSSLPGEDRELWKASIWNWIDFVITVTSIVDLALTLNGGASRANATALIRICRLVRALRIIKLFRISIIQDVMHIFSGLILGSPLLGGVLCLLAVTIYLASAVFRIVFAPESSRYGQISLVERCGFDGDHVPETHLTEECSQHNLYMEEYFGSMDRAIFTIFRCITWDCGTDAGRSLTGVLSRGFGLPFNIAYVIFTIWVVCGVMNVIMASFVQRTTHELEVQESIFLQQRLKALADRIVRYAQSRRISRISEEPSGSWPLRGQIELSHDQFCELFNSDKQVRRIMRELGMDVDAKDLFFLLDTDESGSVDAVEIMDSLVMLSNINKPGTVSWLIAISSMSNKLNEMQSC